MERKTLGDMKCGYCSKIGHTARTCESKKTQIANDNEMQRRKDKAQSKRYTFQDHKAVKSFLSTMTAEGKESCLNGRLVKSAHFKTAVKPETAICETVIEPFLVKVGEHCGADSPFVREPTFDTVHRKKRHLDYLLKIGNRQWFIEAEAPNKTHIGKNQIEEFLHSVPNVSHYGYIVTDGYHYHICKPNCGDVIEWEHITIKQKRKLFKRITGQRMSVWFYIIAVLTPVFFAIDTFLL